MTGGLIGAKVLTPEDAPIDITDFYGSFVLSDDETVTQLRAAYESLMERYLAMIEGLDLDAELTVGPMPWYGVTEPAPGNMRYLAVHHLEEFARHAGHADIIREQIDGAKAAELNAAVEGRPANEFVTPWRAETAD